MSGKIELNAHGVVKGVQVRLVRVEVLRRAGSRPNTYWCRLLSDRCNAQSQLRVRSFRFVESELLPDCSALLALVQDDKLARHVAQQTCLGTRLTAINEYRAQLLAELAKAQNNTHFT